MDNYFEEEVGIKKEHNFAGGDNSARPEVLIGEDHAANAGWSESEGGFDFRKISQWLLYAAAFLVPLFVLPFSAEVIDYNKQLLVVILAGASAVFYLLDVIKSGMFKYRTSTFYIPVAALLAVLLLASFFSVNPHASFLGVPGNSGNSFVVVAFLALMFFVGVNVIDDKGEKLRQILTLSAALALVLAALQVAGANILKPLGGLGRSFNTVGPLNSLGMLAAAILPLFMASRSEGGLWSKLIFASRFAGLVLAVFFLVLINWWPVWLVAFVSMVVWMMFKVFEIKKIKMSVFALPLALVVIGTFLMLIGFNLPLKSGLPAEVSVSSRASMSIAKNVLGEKTIFGYGLGNFGIAYDEFKPSGIAATVFSQTRFNNASSEALNYVAGGGLLAILGFLFLSWYLGLDLVRRFRNSSDGLNSSAVPPVIAFALMAFLYPMNLTILFVAVMAFALFAISSSGSEQKVVELENSPVLSLVGSVAFIVVLVGVLTGGYFVANRYIASVHFANAAKEENQEEKIGLLVKAVNADRREALYSKELSVAIIAKLAADINKTVPPEERQEHNARIQNNIVSAVDIAKRATDMNPADAQNWFNRGFVYQNLMGLVGGAENIAVEMYKESLARNPQDPLAYTRIGNTYLAVAENRAQILSRTPRNQTSQINALREEINSSLDKAVESYQEAISLNPNNGRAIYNLAATYERMGNLSGAISQLERIRAAQSRDPSIVFQLGLLYYRNNQKEAAFNAWQQAVALFPQYSNARWYLSLIYEERGDLENALAQALEVQKLNSENEIVSQRVEQLEAGRRIIPPETVLDQEPL